MPSVVRQGKRIPGYNRHPGSMWIDTHLSGLPNNEWVASNGTGLVAHDTSMDGLIAKIKDKKIDLAEVAIAFITSDSV